MYQPIHVITHVIINFITKSEIRFISIFQLHFSSNLWPTGFRIYFIRCNHAKYEYIFKIVLHFYIIIR